ncbi:MAG: molybdopterin-dependent oxidoreductase [Rhodobacteraceae bacterium]|nr:molybdopterin-dependent oxidoreductase [Paracoccaceae bacterium]
MDRPATSPATGFMLNGVAVQAAPRPGERLSETLRGRMLSTDVKIGCNAGDCGICTVLVDGDPVCACLMPAHRVQGRAVETPAGLARVDPWARRLARSFQAEGAAQCGICIPGMIVSAVALLRADPRPDEPRVMDALGGVLCRCTGYRKIVDAVMRAHLHEDHGGPLAEGDGHTGAAIERLDGAAKVMATERFGDDVAPPDALAMRVIRSPHDHAAFEFGDLEGFVAVHPGIETVLTARDIPGENSVGVIPGFLDQPVLAETVARFRGEAVAALIGTADALRDAVLPVIWTPRAAVTTPRAAMAPDAPQLHPDRPGNVMCRGYVSCGDAEAALARADVVVEGRFSTACVEHAYLEPEAGYARAVGDRIELRNSTQAPGMDREMIARVTGLPLDRVRVQPTAVGGGFGSKLDVTIEPLLALAVQKTGKTVRGVFERTESMQSTSKRHPSDITMRIGAKADGRLCGFVFDGTFNTGAYSSWGPTVATRAPIHASGPYAVADYTARSVGVFTNGPNAGAFRGFGVPQTAIAQEALFDTLADRLGHDRLAFRILNALENGVPTVTGQVFSQGVGIRRCLTALQPAWDRLRAQTRDFNAAHDRVKRGVGVASCWYGCGNTALSNPSTFRAGIRADGRVVLHQGAMDIGQGANTVIAQIFARALGVPVSTIELVGPDTDVTPDAGKTSASRQTFISGNAARIAGETLRRRVLARMNAGPDTRLRFGDGAVHGSEGALAHRIALDDLPAGALGYVFEAVATYDPPTTPLDENGQGAAYAQFGYAAQLAMVEVDLALATTRVLHVTAAHDVGHAINPLLVEGQVHGGVAQGLGMALMEEYVPHRTENLHDYLIPTIGDVPPIDVLLIEEPDAHGPYGAKGLGEHALIPTAPAILNAIHDACGARVTQTPATPARLRAALAGGADG